MRSRWRGRVLAPIAAVQIISAAASLFCAEAHAAEQEHGGAGPRKYLFRWTTDPADTNTVYVEVGGFTAADLQKPQQEDWKTPQWQQLLSVYAEQGDVIANIGLPPVLGAYRVESNTLRFKPQFPFEPGVTYRAVLRPDRLAGERGRRDELVTSEFRMPARRGNPSTVVNHVYPSAEVLPENLLKFYLHFSAPMSRGHIYDHIHLKDEAGKEVELPFLEIDEELWDPTMTRLTLFIDPGRIKRGVRPLEEVGPALQEGRRYTLVIDRTWRDGTGNPLREPYQRTFRVGPPDRNPPDAAQWKIQPPKSKTRDPLTVTFSEPMDHALAARVIRVAGASGVEVDGKAALEDQERRWTFIPNRPWPRGSFTLVVQTTIEDLAGNNIGKPFEVDLFEGVQRRLTNSTVKLPFVVR